MDIKGQKFGRLTVIEFHHSDKGRYWLCKCDCGKFTILNTNKLKFGNTKSCGCLAKEKNSKRFFKHGANKTRLYICWKAMRQRVSAKNKYKLKYYYKRGITVCDEWKEFTNFSDWALLNGYSNFLTLDRIDNNKGYSPDNCRWIKQEEQTDNMRRNILLEYNGEKMTLTKWANKVAMERTALYYRIRIAKWSMEKALFTPVGASREKQKCHS
jgi:hypothetical protein